MFKRVFGFLAMALALVCTISGAATKPAGSPATGTCTESAIPCDTETFTPGDNVSRLFTFPGFPDTLEIKFRKVINTFSLTILRQPLTAAQFAARLGFSTETLSTQSSSSVFPPGSACYQYDTSIFPNVCVGYDGFGTLPIKRTDYLGPVTWTVVYLSNETGGNPALGHAIGTSLNYTEDILQFYSTLTVSSEETLLLPRTTTAPVTADDPTMSGSSDGLTSVATIKEPLTENDTFCWVSPSNGQTFRVGQEVEVAFQLFASGGCPNTGTPLRDKDARLSVATLIGGRLVFVPVRGEEGGNRRFHFEKEEGVNEREFETDDLAPGTYFITIRSNKFSPQTRRIVLTPGTDHDH